MFAFLTVFIWSMIVYQIIHTMLVFGWWDGMYHQYVSASKDLVWILACCVIAIRYRTLVYKYIQSYRVLLITFVCVIVRSILLSVWQGVSTSLIIIGFKYVLYPWVIMVTALWIGYCVSQTTLDRYLKRFGRAMLITMYLGIAWFALKLMMPTMMYHLWYGPVGDFVVWYNPPLYYRTWAWWRPRYSGLMAWPNNLAYLLVGLWPMMMVLRSSYKHRLVHYMILMLSIVATFSRSARIALWGQYFYKQYSTHRLSIYHIIGIIAIWVMMVMILMTWKYQSTLEHFQSTLQAVQTRLSQPRWYGLGYSGPSALHHGSIIPENTYLQWLIDIGIVGCGGIMIMIYVLVSQIKKIRSDPYYGIYVQAWCLGMIWLALQGMFLHVLEDSTVNYLMFVSGGLLIWYLSHVDRHH